MKPSPITNLNILICRRILTLVLKGFKRLSQLLAAHRIYPATYTPRCSVIEEIVEGFVEGFISGVRAGHALLSM